MSNAMRFTTPTSPESQCLAPALQEALQTLDVRLEDEFIRYRQSQSRDLALSTPPAPVTSAVPPVTAPQDTAFIPLGLDRADPGIEQAKAPPDHYLESTAELLRSLEDSGKTANQPAPEGYLPPALRLGLVLLLLATSTFIYSSSRDLFQLEHSPDQGSPETSRAITQTAANNVDAQDIPPQQAATTSPSEPQRSSTPSDKTAAADRPQVSADGFYYVVTDHQDERNFNLIRQVVPDAFIDTFSGETRIQVGAFETLEKAEEHVQDLQAQGIQAKIYIP